MSKDVIFALVIAIACLGLIAVAFVGQKSKTTTPEAPKTEITALPMDSTSPMGAPGQSLSDPFAPTAPLLDGTAGGFPQPTPGTGLPTSPGKPGSDPFGLPPINSAPTGGFPGGGSFGAPLAPAPIAGEMPATEEAKTHVVKSGELLGDIAQKYYGSSKQWKRIVEANPGLDPKNVKVGQKLIIPQDAPKTASTEPPTAAQPGEKTYIVKSGDTLYLIAKRELGSASRWKEIEELNKISSSDLKVGQSLRIPGAKVDAAPLGAALETTPAAGKTHTVAKGELLGDISRKYYGTTKNWKKIVEANPGVSPENLKVGQKLVIPDVAGDAVAPAAGGALGDYTVKAGDTFSTIAEKELGSKKRWKDIQEANPGVDPKSLRAGQKLKVPGKSPAPETAPAPAPAPAPVTPFGAAPAAQPFGVAPAAQPFGAAPASANASPFGTEPSFASPYGQSGFGQPAQPFTAPGANAGAQPLPTSPFDQPIQPAR